MIYDLTQIYNELDLLEIRLNILDPYVDYFVIGESTQTFSGKEKPLYFLENIKRFDKWKHKIIHKTIGEFKTDSAFERAGYQKDSLRDVLKGMNPEDIVIYGDVDEIINPNILKDIGNEIYKLRQLNYSYYLNNRSSEDWQGTNVCKYKNLVNLNELRANHDNVIDNGGWHFTNAGGLEQILKKLDAYDHQEMNTETNREKLAERIENNEDYVGRQVDWQGKPFEMWIDESQIPNYLLDNKEIWKHLFK